MPSVACLQQKPKSSDKHAVSIGTVAAAIALAAAAAASSSSSSSSTGGGNGNGSNSAASAVTCNQTVVTDTIS